MRAARGNFTWAALADRTFHPADAVPSCKDGKFVALGALEHKFWARFLQTAGVDEASWPNREDRERWPELRQRLTVLFASRTREEWAALLEPVDACVSAVLDEDEAPRSAAAAERSSFAEDAAGCLVPRPAPRLSRTPAIDPVRQAPGQGEHTVEVLRAVGLTAEEIELACGGAGAVDPDARPVPKL